MDLRPDDEEPSLVVGNEQAPAEGALCEVCKKVPVDGVLVEMTRDDATLNACQECEVAEEQYYEDLLDRLIKKGRGLGLKGVKNLDDEDARQRLEELGARVRDDDD